MERELYGRLFSYIFHFVLIYLYRARRQICPLRQYLNSLKNFVLHSIEVTGSPVRARSATSTCFLILFLRTYKRIFETTHSSQPYVHLYKMNNGSLPKLSGTWVTNRRSL